MPAAGRLLLPAAALSSACTAVTLRTVQHAFQGPDELLRLSGGHRVLATKTTYVQGHNVSSVSARWTGRVVYATFTTAVERYHDNLVAQLETWAARPAKEGRYVVVGGSNYPDEWRTDSILKSNCGDGIESVSCKEATMLAEGAARGADWLVVVDEDNYVHTRHVEKRLSSLDPDEPVAYGQVGCGRGLFCHDVPDFETRGGLCGGSGYIISRAALQKLLAEGAPALHAVYDGTTDPEDMTTSCQLRKHGSQLRDIAGMHISPIFRIRDYQDMVDSEPWLTVHYMQPAMLRWMHGAIEGADRETMQRLEDRAFDNGCARKMNTTFWVREYNACWRSSGGKNFPHH